MWYIYIYNGVLLSHKRGWNWVICRDMNGLRVCLQNEVRNKYPRYLFPLKLPFFWQTPIIQRYQWSQNWLFFSPFSLIFYEFLYSDLTLLAWALESDRSQLDSSTTYEVYDCERIVEIYPVSQPCFIELLAEFSKFMHVKVCHHCMIIPGALPGLVAASFHTVSSPSCNILTMSSHCAVESGFSSFKRYPKIFSWMLFFFFPLDIGEHQGGFLSASSPMPTAPGAPSDEWVPPIQLHPEDYSQALSHISPCLLDMFLWMSKPHLKLHSILLKLFIHVTQCCRPLDHQEPWICLHQPYHLEKHL